ncbi:MAG: ABC transporter ATP-binding protein [Lawsonibacter sp.]|nr:ABC transporter ATP-binding protein [Lawsonibacter sp.]MCI8810584.1 ABC transporter ATP-binding protein [Oscillibacter sp.]
MISVQQLDVYYGPIQALHNVNISVNQGEIVAIIGNNGAGKSTLLKTISGLVKPTNGQILFEEKSIGGAQADTIVKLGISHTPEGRMVFPDLSVEMNLVAGAYTRTDRAGIREDLKKYYKKFPILEERKNQKAGLMSGGEQQMLAIARSLMSRPKLLMLDEPSLGLAPVVVDEVYKIIREISTEGTTILLIEQNATRALNVADRAYILSNGTIELSGTGKELAANDEVRKAYLGV